MILTLPNVNYFEVFLKEKQTQWLLAYENRSVIKHAYNGGVYSSSLYCHLSVYEADHPVVYANDEQSLLTRGSLETVNVIFFH
jgi:hypothetical protein